MATRPTRDSPHDILADLLARLPDAPPRVRPFTPRDASRVAQWINAARREGVFRPGERATASSVLAWQARAKASHHRYDCHVVESEAGRPIGYFDWTMTRRAGEILGIYVESSHRRRGIGQHLIRWAVCAMREHGAREVSAWVYPENIASQRAFQTAGFTVAPGKPVREAGRVVERLRRPLSPPPRWLPRRLRYRALRGENLYLHHAAVGDLVAGALASIPGVELVLGMGSIARGFGDVASDIDLGVIGRGAGVACLHAGEHPAIGTTLDLFVVDLDRDPCASWDVARRQAFQECVVLHAGDAATVKAVRRAVALGQRERTERIVELLFRVGWLGFHPPSWEHRRRGGYVWSVPHDGWVARGNLSSAHNTIDQAVDHALQLTFLVGGEHPPDPKWRRFLVTGAPWRPRGLDAALTVLDTAPRDVRGFALRASALRAWMGSIGRRLIAEGIVHDGTYDAFLARCVDYRRSPQ